jgi:hypothetical protein
MSKVHMIAAAAGSMAAIADGGMTPIVKDSTHADGKKVATFADRTNASILAAEVMAQVMAQDNVWRGYAMRIIGMSIEGRAAFVEIIGSTLKDTKKRNTLDGAVEAKAAAKRVASATVEVSKLRTVAMAFNAGASLDGLRQYAWETTGKGVNSSGNPTLPEVEHIGYTVLVEYARTFSDSKAGRKADTWAQKFAKFLERNQPAEDDAVAVAQYDAAVKLSNSFTA